MTTSPVPFTVLIAGGGVGGLTLAKALLEKAQEAASLKVVVLERASELPSSGHGLTLFEGVGILRRLGLGEKLQQPTLSSVLTRQVVTADTKPVVDVQTDSSSATSDSSSKFAPRGIRRPNVVQLLADSLPKGVVHYDWEVIQVEQLSESVKVTNNRNESIQGDVLVGFDGIGGAVCAHVMNDPLQVSSKNSSSSSKEGQREFGKCCVLLGSATLDRDDASTSTFQPGTLVHHFDRTTGSVGVYSGTGTTNSNGNVSTSMVRVAWTIGYRCLEEPERSTDWNNNDKALASAKRLVQDWSKANDSVGADFDHILSKSTGCLQLGVYTQPTSVSARPWSRGRVVLGGDAAHAVLPLLGEGANLAMADAVVLARHLVKLLVEVRQTATVKGSQTKASITTKQLSTAFQAYESERRAPSQSGMAMTKALRPIMLSQNWFVCQGRNVFMGHMIATTWTNSADQRGQDAHELLDRPMADRNPHANIGSNLGMVLAHVVMIVGAVSATMYLLKK